MPTAPLFNLVHLLVRSSVYGLSPPYGLSPAAGIFDLQVAEALKFLFAFSAE